ncbi:DUF7115 domain-containing protein [Halobacterium litoreum]|uniref:DUF7115 domain-containing protein n=1 Tax=Halobacterium litoreum TaxID=2039234 RepID=A0ABD5NDE8_9EURY|nr:hypothetical protein [Halobacterium litoreum]UHH14030.1 hypothetical protein LT972_03285 [Halobacterium litoreum]
MNAPALVQSSLEDEDVAAHVPLKGEDALFVTPTRTVVYKADGLLSDEGVDEYPHDAERIEVSEGRRKAKVTMDYGLDGDDTFSVPSKKLDDVLHPVLAGVLNAAGVTGPGETVKRTFRFSELTLVVTSDRVVKHVGAAMWGPDHEEIDFETVTGIDVEEGSVASQLVLETTGRTERIKAPSEEFRDVRETVEEAVFAFHDAANAAEFERMNVDESPEEEVDEVSFGGGVDPIDTSGVGEDDEESAAEPEPDRASEPTTGEPASDDGASDEFASSGFQTAAEKVEPPVDPDELDAELDQLEAAIADLAETVDSQQEVIDQQQAVIDAQQTVLAEQRERLDALRELSRDQ